MLRRVFLVQVLCGLLAAIIQKLSKKAITQPALTSSLFAKSEPINLYVDPLLGSDNHSGQLAGKNSGAVATINRAKTIARELTRQYRPIQINLREGMHFLPEPVVFTPEDSGKVNCPITYQSAPKERAVVSGGKLITGWRRETVNGQKMWTADLSTGDFGQFQHLWINGQRRSRSRYPSQGYLKIKKSHSKKKQPWTEGNNLLEYRLGDLPDTNAGAFKGAELVVMTRWVESHVPIAKIDPVKRLLHFDKTSVLKLYSGDLYYLENSLAWLDNPGEWYLDAAQSKLYYLPLPTEKIEQIEAIAPVLDALFVFEGNKVKRRSIRHLKFKNLTFSHTDWRLPPGVSGFNQNAWEVPAAIRAIALDYSTWSYCTFAHLGNHGLHLGEDCQYSRISYCKFFDLGGGAIKIGHKRYLPEARNPGRGNHHHLILGNQIAQGGKYFHSASAIAVSRSHHNLIARNHIHDYYYTGISVMGAWNFNTTQAHHNLIQNNHIHHLGRLSSGDGSILSDMGGIYIVGVQRGTKILHNRIHDVSGVRYGGWGIYFDEGSSYILAEDNLVYRTSHGGFAQHYGRENIIRNNIFAFGAESQIHRHKKDLEISRKQKFVSLRFENNIVYWQSGRMLSGMTKNYQDHAVFNRNIYWQLNQSNFKLGNLSWQEWRQRDRYSQIIDPLFIAPEADNFKLQADSPVYLGASS